MNMNMMRPDDMGGFPTESIENMSMMRRYIRFLFESLRKCFTVTKYFLYYFGFKFVVLHGLYESQKHIRDLKEFIGPMTVKGGLVE